jgi:hypothetical protein
MYDILTIAFALSYLLLIWLKTNAFTEYMTLFRLGRFFHIAEFNQLYREGYGGVYVDFLGEYYSDSFLVRLVKCPICLSFWSGTAAAILHGSLEGILFPPLILLFYLLFNKML